MEKSTPNGQIPLQTGRYRKRESARSRRKTTSPADQVSEKKSEIPVYSIRLTIESAALTAATKMTG